MWQAYFGDKVTIYGIDFDPRCKQFESEKVKIFIGSKSDRTFLKEVIKKIPMLDILIDDGRHTMEQQIVSYEELFKCVKEDGVYLIEDLHTSYWLTFGGGHKMRNTYIEYSKDFIVYLNAFHSKQQSLQADSFTTSVNSIHYYGN